MKPGDTVYIFDIPYMYTLANLLYKATFTGMVKVGFIECAEVELQDGTRKVFNIEQLSLVSK